MSKKAQFGSRLGLIAATVGSAVGLGNIWRFPAEAQANGGAAFLLLYIGCVAVLGVPVMLGEFALGRGTGKDATGAFRELSPRTPWWLTGALAIVASYLILSFYMVVAGWTLEYFVQSVTGWLYAEPPAGQTTAQAMGERMRQSIEGPWWPLLATYAMIAANTAILRKGVNKGIEKMSNVMMPVLFVLLLVLVGVAMTLPRAAAGLEFFFRPDFSRLGPETALDALGQAFFSLSLGMGILVTYSSYFPRSEHLGRTALTVSGLDLLVAVMTGMVIFPAVMSFGLQGESMSGATLVFVTLPEVFARMPLSALWSSLFFLLLMVAALTSTMSLAEVTVAFLQDRFGMRRGRACLVALLPLAVLSTLCSLSQGPLAQWKILGLDIFGLLDTAATNFMLPVVALATCLFLGWRQGPFTRRELANRAAGRPPLWTRLVLLMLRWVCPLLIALILAQSIAALL